MAAKKKTFRVKLAKYKEVEVQASDILDAMKKAKKENPGWTDAPEAELIG